MLYLMLFGIAYVLPMTVAARPQPQPPMHTLMPSWPSWAASGNASNDKLLTMPEKGQAAMLSKATGYGCIGQDPFYMGTEKRPPNNNVSLWSLSCSNTSRKYLIAIAPDETGSTVVIDCKLLTKRPWKCYKKIK
jgi:hypothetical protein